MSRIKSLTSTPKEIIVELADGNPGAARVIADMFARGPEIDPDNALGGLGSVLFLDALGIYGPRVWMLYRDVCGEDLTKVLASLRAVQMGLAKSADLWAALDGMASFDADAALAAVKEKLPAFAA